MKKWQHYFDILKALFVRDSSEYKASDSDREVNQNMYPDMVSSYKMHLIDSCQKNVATFSCCCKVL